MRSLQNLALKFTSDLGLNSPSNPAIYTQNDRLKSRPVTEQTIRVGD